MSTDLPIQSDSPGFYAASVPANGVPGQFLGQGWEPEGEAKGGGVKRYLDTLLRYKWLILAVTLVGSVGGFLVSRFVKKTYVVQGTVWLDDRGGGRAGPIQEGQLLEQSNWDELLKSYQVLEPVVISQRLYADYDEKDFGKLFSGLTFADTTSLGEFRVKRQGRVFTIERKDGVFAWSPVAQARAGDSLGLKLGFKWVPQPRDLPEGKTALLTINRPRDVAVELGKQIQSKIKKNGAFMRLELVGDNPRKLTRTMNALIERFVKAAADLKRGKLDEFAALLRDQLGVAEQNLHSIENELESFRISTVTLPSEVGTVVNDSKGAPTPTSTYIAIKLQEDQLHRDREALKRAITHARDSVFSIAELEAIPAVQGASELKAVLNEITGKRAQMRVLLYQYTDLHPDVKKLRGEIDIAYSETLPVMVRALDQELARREAELAPSLATATEELKSIPPRVMEEKKLARQLAIADNLYTMLRQRNEEAQLAALSSTPDLRVIDPAKLPRRPLSDKRLQIILLGILGSLGAAVGGVLLFDRMDPRVRYPEQVTHGLRLPILAAVPQLKNHNGNGRSVESTSQAVEAFRSLRLTLLHAVGNDRGLVTAISSPGSGDGKSFVSMNLALAFAEQGYRTILIDGDTRRGTLHRFVGCSRKPGLTDLLGGTTTRDQVIQKTSYPRLEMIPCGTRLQSGPELLGSPEMPALIRELRAKYDVVLIDSPPLGAGVDPYVLGTTTGNMIIVLRAGYTDREFTEAKLSSLDGLPIKVIGAILNGVPAGGAYRYYSYLAGYEATDEAVAAPTALVPT